MGPPVIIAQPQSLTVGELQSAAFTVQMNGSPPFTFQWLKNGLAIPGATNISFTLPVAFSDSGAGFSIEISNPAGSVTSSNAVLVVVPKTTPPFLLGATNLTLETVEVAFSEPINETTATNLANYSIHAAQGGLAVLSAALAADRATVILTTERQGEGTQYTLTVNGITDTSVAGNPIAADTQVQFTPSFPNEFVGPFASWADVKRDFGAKGDGVTDDTAQIQQALDSIGISDRDWQRPASGSSLFPGRHLSDYGRPGVFYPTQCECFRRRPRKHHYSLGRANEWRDALVERGLTLANWPVHLRRKGMRAVWD